MKTEDLIKQIKEAMNATREDTGSFKYNFAYQEYIKIIKNYAGN